MFSNDLIIQFGKTAPDTAKTVTTTIIFPTSYSEHVTILANPQGTAVRTYVFRLDSCSLTQAAFNCYYGTNTGVSQSTQSLSNWYWIAMGV